MISGAFMKPSPLLSQKNILRDLLILFALWGAGEFLHRVIGFFIPGTVSGFLLFFLLLLFKIIPPESLEHSCDFFLKNLGFFFIPPGVALIALGGVFKKHGVSLLAVVLVSTVAVFAVTGLVTQWIIERQEKNHG